MIHTAEDWERIICPDTWCVAGLLGWVATFLQCVCGLEQEMIRHYHHCPPQYPDQSSPFTASQSILILSTNYSHLSKQFLVTRPFLNPNWSFSRYDSAVDCSLRAKMFNTIFDACDTKLMVLEYTQSRAPPQNPSYRVHIRSGMDMKTFPDPLHTSHPLVERVRWQGLNDERRLYHCVEYVPWCTQPPIQPFAA